MNIETILNAAMMAHQSLRMNMPTSKAYRRARQSFVFRARILRTVAEKDDEIAYWKASWQSQLHQLKEKNKKIAEYRKEIIEKDEEIRVLEKYIKDHDYKTILDYMEKYLEGDIE